ncbi:MAG: hypothetical protein IJA86_05055 [Clostridia bacterium]|nr:hypothetical protein [Clostridia bacterium]
MMKLLRAGFRRYFKNILFWISLTVSAVIGLASGKSAYDNAMVDDIYVIIGFIVFAVLIALMVGREFSDGGFRNKITLGHTKGKIFISEYIVALCVCLILFFISAGFFILLNISNMKKILPELLTKASIGYILFTISMITIIFTTSVLISRKAITVVTTLILVLGLYIVACELDTALSIPEYQQVIDWVDGKPVLTQEYVKSKNYIDSPMRENLIFLFNIIPSGQSIQYYKMIKPLLNPNNIIIFISEEKMQLLNTLPYYSAGTILTLLSGAYIAFRKKDFI